MKRRIEGVVIGITRNQEGWGDTARDIGINIEVEYNVTDVKLTDDGDFKELARKSTIVLPFEMRALVTVGDTMVLEFGHTQEWLPAEVDEGDE